MSRIGKKSIILSNKINTHIYNNKITIQGPKGEISQEISPNITIKQKDNELILTKKENSKIAEQLYGLSRTLINNMVLGVSVGFRKKLEIRGVGYRAKVENNKLTLNVGYSHPIEILFPKDILIEVENNTMITIEGINKEIVGQVAARIRQIRPPEPYKGKGIRYNQENVRKKIGKAGK
uniref:Ribosomal protein L6 n=1 Tax=Sporolithon durum TaxID=48970 RepID=A0A141SD83_9FLOR|nr:ribosomal protein L6 [Sporolithon durum]AMK96251.1 ribosomal protein L6 [Sporolithon durum]